MPSVLVLLSEFVVGIRSKMKTFHSETLRFVSLPSTNLEAAKHAAAGAASGLWVVASEQTAGRGRQGREWSSPRGAGIYCSVLLRPQFDQNDWPLLTLLAAVAVQDALIATCKLKTDIKWPNDILHDGKKLCGILAETVETTNGRDVVIGIGINLTNESFPPELETHATSVAAGANSEPDLEKVLKTLQRCFMSRYEDLKLPAGPARVVSEWMQRSSYAEGKTVSVTEGDEEFAGTTRGLEPDGALRVETASGEIRIVRAGDVSVRQRPTDNSQAI
jgi:BirA family biotin operon repressor/biotin-[acetyl-CoA-carboxylase] ligase